MRLKTVVKLGTMVSVLLFALAIGYYALMRLDVTGQSKDVDLFSLVPSDCVAVLENENIYAFWNEYPDLNYSRELDSFQFSGLFHFLFNELNVYTNEHGLSHEMGHLIVSFHHPGSSLDQVVYFQKGMTDGQLLSDVLQEYMPSNFIPKEEVYRGKSMLVYPLFHDKFLVAYTEDNFVVLSYQKRLVEEVIDAQLNGTSLSQDVVFSQILKKKKTNHSLKLYGRSVALPVLNVGMECWSEYDFHLNSDVLYLMGETYMPESSSYIATVKKCLEEVPVVKEEEFIVSTERDSTIRYMEQTFEMNDEGSQTLFNECVANLAEEVDFSLVVDMQKVEKESDRFQSYLPPFVLSNASCFRSFILSEQLSLNGGRMTHMWVFTYKN